MKVEEALKIVQEKSTKQHSKLMERIDENPEEIKNQVISYIEQILKDENIQVDEYFNDEEGLAKRLYKEMSGFSILDEYLTNKNIEEINVLSWKDIRIHYDDGRVERAPLHFFNAQHCNDIFRKLLEKSGMVFNISKPIQIGYLNTQNNVRITALNEEIIDKGLGVNSSIRIINPKGMVKEDFIKKGECNDEMLNFLSLSYKYGISECFSGETGSGKTTLMSYILSQVPDDKRLITMEEKTREYNLHKYDKNGYMINNVTHLVTRESDKEDENITLSDLLKTALTLDPNYICVNEMKGEESVQAVAAANTGHAVISTTHASSNIDVYDRILFLSKQGLKNDIDTNILLNMICRAFPITVNIKMYPDKVRRIAEISECLGLTENNQIKMNTLYRFKVDYNERKDNKIYVYGNFEKVNVPSEKIKNIFYMNGADNRIINQYFYKKGQKNENNICH